MPTKKTAEDLRLLYVALTRAEEQLNIYAAANKNCTPNNPFAYLLEGLPDAGREIVSQSYKSATDVVEMLKTNWQRFIKTRLKIQSLPSRKKPRWKPSTNTAASKTKP